MRDALVIRDLCKALAQRKPGAGNLIFMLGPMAIGFLLVL